MGYHNAITVGEFVGVQKRANQSDPEKPFLNFEFKLSANSDFTTSLSASQSSGVGEDTFEVGKRYALRINEQYYVKSKSGSLYSAPRIAGWCPVEDALSYFKTEFHIT